MKPPDKRIQEPRIADQLWTPNDDFILNTMVELYHSNWLLVADALNMARRSVSTDRRTAWDCYHRWTLLTAKSDLDPPTSSVTNPSSRPKRHAATNGTESAAANSNSNFEARKRRRHLVMQEAMRKVVKKREIIAKAAGG
jgi:chromatin modification-related protein VID21